MFIEMGLEFCLMEEQILIFWNLKKNRSKSAGIYYFSHRKMFGFIGITKKENSRLIDKSGREGFVANDAYRAMKTMLMEFLSKLQKKSMEQILNSEKSRRNKKKKKKEEREFNKAREEKKLSSSSSNQKADYG